MTQPKPFSRLKRILLLCFLFSNFISFQLSAQCDLACNTDVIQVTLGVNCTTEVLPDVILEGLPNTTCPGPYLVEVLDAQGNPIPTSPFVNDSHHGQFFDVRVTHINTGVFCEGQIQVLDNLIPALTCQDIEVPCGTSLLPSRPEVANFDVGVSVDANCTNFVIPAIFSTTSILDVEMSFDIEHASVGELSLFITSPDGTPLTLFDNLGPLVACAGSNLQVTFDDQAVNTYSDFENTCGIDPAIQGSFQPKDALSALETENPTGGWTIILCDNSAGNVATINSISISVNGTAITIPFPLPDSALVSQTSAQQGTNEYTIANFENCGNAILSFQDEATSNACSDPFAETIERTWTISDALGNTTSCLQTIDLSRLPAGSIMYPQDYDGSDQPALLCEERTPDPGNSVTPNIGWNILPNGNPSPFDEYYPAPNDNVVKWFGTGVPFALGCENIGYSFDDVRIDVCQGSNSDACFKVVRTWNIWETCSGQSYTHEQKIKVVDDSSPTISGVADLTISTPGDACVASWVASVPVLNDNCNPTNNLSYTVHSSSGQVNYNANTGQYTVPNLAIGTYQITYIASDCCGASGSTTIELTVEDQVPPTATCVSFITSSLTIDGTTRILPESFDDNGNDNCGLVYHKVIRMEDLLGTDDGSNSNQNSTDCDPENGDDNLSRFGNQIYFDDFVAFCCEDIGAQGLMVVLRTFDVDPGPGPVNPNRMRPGGNLHGHFNDCMTEVIIEDKLPPAVFCPDPITIDCTENPEDLNLTGEATGYDNCSIPDLDYTDDESGLNDCGVGFIIRTWTATDHNGMTATCTQRIDIIDETDPIVIFPGSPVEVECGEENDFDITGQPDVSDNCSLIGVGHRDEIYPIDDCLFKVLRVWNVMDWCTGQQWSQAQVIKVTDNTPPVFENMPPNITVECDDIPPADQTPDVTDNCDPDPEISVEETEIPGDCPQERTIIREWTATDNCDNTTVRTQTISVEDNTPPVISGVPADMTLECGETPVDGNPSATDNCDPLVQVVPLEDIIPGSCPDNFILERTWTATDDCGNTTQEVQRITFDDSLPPVFDQTPVDMTIECGNPIPDGDPTATDNCAMPPQVQLDESSAVGVCPELEVITREWTATDNCGNSAVTTQIITITDTTAPDISDEPVDVTVECSDPLPTDMPSATDICDNVLDLDFDEQRTNGACEDEYTLTRTWTFTDDCDNPATAVQVITVEDNTPPEFVDFPADEILDCSEMPTNLEPTATDNCDPDVDISFMDSTSPNCTGNETISRTWTATDRCGNSVSSTQMVTFMDDTPPVFEGVPADETVECDMVPPPAMVTAMDACDPEVTPVFDEIRTDGNCPYNYTLTRTWTATDDCGNTATTTQVVTVEDTTPPDFVDFPIDMTVECTQPTDPANTGMPGAMDNCDPNPVVDSSDEIVPGDCPQEYTIIRTWTATDICGNDFSMDQTIEVIDDSAPTISNVPGNIMVECHLVPDPPDNVTASDNCDPNPDLSFDENRNDGQCEDEYTLIRSWTATDACGNEITLSQTITVFDDTPPVITGVPDDTTVVCSEVPAPPIIPDEVSATDNCDTDVDIEFDEMRTNGQCIDEYTLTRTWVATDNCGNATTEMQVINVIDTIPPELINIPPDLTVACENLDDTTSAMMVMASDNCDLDVDLVYDENMDGSCPNDFIIFRTWTATDNCGNESTGSQMITVLDTLAPQINCPGPVTIVIDEGDAIDIFTPKCDTFLNLAASAIDNCADIITITHDSPFADDPASTTGNASGRYPFGTHIITYTAEDRCGNQSTCSTRVIVADDAVPTILCSGFDIVLDAIDSTVVLTPDNFITFLAECNVDTIFFMLPEMTDTLVLDCDDTGILFDVQICVVDDHNNKTCCTVFDQVVETPVGDPTFCGFDPPPVSYIKGRLTDEFDQPLDNVMTYLTGEMDMEEPSDPGGRYIFPHLPTGYNYSIRPENDNNIREGVNTLDLVLISRHLIGLDPLDSPYQLIAADVDNSGSINTFDLISLQQVILFVEDHFADNTSWRFIDEDYVFDDPANPFASPFPEQCFINGLEFGVGGVDFVGVKIGDVDGTISGINAAASSRQDPDLTMTAPDVNLQKDKEFNLEIRSDKLMDLVAMQFTLDFDPTLLEIIGVEGDAMRSGLNIGETQRQRGLLPFSWYQPDSHTFSADELLFTLRLKAKENVALSKALRLNSALTKAEAFDGDMQSYVPRLEFRDSEDILSSAEFTLFPNRPNPFKDETIISFYLPRSAKTVLTISDVSGHQIKEIKGELEKGYHEIPLTSDELGTAGLLYYRLQSGSDVAIRKMILIKE